MMSEERTDDGLLLVDKILRQDEIIKQYTRSERDGLRIKFYKYPETGDVDGTFIVLESILNEKPSNYADGTWVTYDYLLHVEVWSKTRAENKIVAKRIRDLLWKELKFKQNDDHEEHDLGIYRDARRYKGVLHRSDLDKI